MRFIPPIVVTNAREVWFATLDAMYYSTDYFLGGQPTWNKVSTMPDANAKQWFTITPSGTAYMVTGSTTFMRDMYMTTTPKTPSWQKILTAGTPAAGSVVSQYFSYLFGPAMRSVEGIYTFAHVLIGWAYGAWNGTSWAWQLAPDPWNTFGPTGVGNDTYSFEQVGCTIMSGNGVHIEQMSNTNVGYEFYRSPAGTRYMSKSTGGNMYLHIVPGQDVVNAGSITLGGMLNDTKITGAEISNHVYAVTANDGSNGFLWLSDDGSAFSHVATWAPGWVYDASSSGGGTLVWFLRSISNNNVPTRLYNRDGSVLRDMTGNFWSLTTGGQTTIGAGLVY